MYTYIYIHVYTYIHIQSFYLYICIYMYICIYICSYEIIQDQVSDHSMRCEAQLSSVKIFARLSPFQKEQIIQVEATAGSWGSPENLPIVFCV